MNGVHNSPVWDLYSIWKSCFHLLGEQKIKTSLLFKHKWFISWHLKMEATWFPANPWSKGESQCGMVALVAGMHWWRVTKPLRAPWIWGPQQDSGVSWWVPQAASPIIGDALITARPGKFPVNYMDTAESSEEAEGNFFLTLVSSPPSKTRNESRGVSIFLSNAAKELGNHPWDHSAMWKSNAPLGR